jgi:glycosyltransferase involved in cell wall biosynthesis
MNPSSYTVSVVIPAWERASWIGETLDSVLGQTRAPDEVIVVDDGSVDDTAAVAAAHPLAPRVLTIPHAGVGMARNRGIEAARGDLVAFLDSDDLWLPEKLDRHVPVFEVPNSPSVSCTHYDVWDLSAEGWAQVETRRHPGPLDVASLLEMNRVGTLTVIAKRAELLAVGGFHEGFMRGSDYELWLRLAERAPIHVLDEVLAVHRRHPHRLTGADPEQDVRTRDDIVRTRSRHANTSTE